LCCLMKDSTFWPECWAHCGPVVSPLLSGLSSEVGCPSSAAGEKSQTPPGEGVDHAQSLNQTLRLQETGHNHYEQYISRSFVSYFTTPRPVNCTPSNVKTAVMTNSKECDKKVLCPSVLVHSQERQEEPRRKDATFQDDD
jgi:hypothetical protein